MYAFSITKFLSRFGPVGEGVGHTGQTR